MVTLQTAALGGLAVAVLLGVSAFFSGSEIAVFSLERHRLESFAEGTDPRGRTLARLREDPHRLLITILVGNNVVNIAMASLVSALAAAAFGTAVGALVATALMSVLVLVVGEITPKSYGVANPEPLALRVARPLAAVQTVLAPVVWLFDGVSGLLNRLTGGDRGIETPYVTREELESLLRTGELAGAIGETERDMVEGVFDLGSTRAREVMVPRVNVVAVDVETSVDEVLDVCSRERLTRLPVYDETLDHVVGIADVRDLVRASRSGATLRETLHPTLQAPDTREIDDLLAEMQDQRVTMVIVRDEFGETEGIITVEDILEEIVGDIFEVGEERLVRHTDDGLVVRGEVTVGEVNDTLGVELPRMGEYETVAGLVNAELGRIGDVGDTVEVDDVSLVVEGVDGNRLSRIRVRNAGVPGGATGPDTEDPGSDVAPGDDREG
jgi:CBS domain containing-hemolysin-like protein